MEYTAEMARDLKEQDPVTNGIFQLFGNLGSTCLYKRDNKVAKRGKIDPNYHF